MSLEKEEKLPIINAKKPLTANKSFNSLQSIKAHDNSLTKKLIKKLNNTTRSISIKKINKTNISYENEKIKSGNSSKKKDHIIKSSYKINNTKGNFLLYKKFCLHSSSEEKNKSKYKMKDIINGKIHIVEEKSEGIKLHVPAYRVDSFV